MVEVVLWGGGGCGCGFRSGEIVGVMKWMGG